MRKVIIILFLIISSIAHTHCQKLFLTVYNRTGIRVQLSIIHYLNDSTNINIFSNAGVRNGLIVGSDKKGGYIGVKGMQIIRTDIIALNDSTKDTIFAKSYIINRDIDENLVVEIIAGEVNNLTKIYPSPCLEIKSNKNKYLIRKNQFVTFILSNGKKVKGEVQSFNDNTITLNSTNSEIITINKNELAKIRRCGYYLYIGGSVKLFPYCRFIKLKKVNFKVINFKP